eukprot:UN20487
MIVNTKRKLEKCNELNTKTNISTNSNKTKKYHTQQTTTPINSTSTTIIKNEDSPISTSTAKYHRNERNSLLNNRIVKP